MHKPYSAFFVGDPSGHEQSIIQGNRLLVDFHVAAIDKTGIEEILKTAPDYVMLPLTFSNKLVLQFFHQLRMDGRTCVIVWENQTLTGFSGRGYRWRRSAPKTTDGLESLLEWGKWPMPVNRRITSQRFLLGTVFAGASLLAEPCM